MNFTISMLLLPLLAAFLSISVRKTAFTRLAVPTIIWLQLILLAFLCKPVFGAGEADLIISNDFILNRTGASFLLLTNFVAACALSHAHSFFKYETLLGRAQEPQHERIFYTSAILFLIAMSFVFICDNLGYLWISIEATTLFSASLVYYFRNKHSLEATWKYLIVCSVGIAFALLGTVLIFASSQHGALPLGSLDISVLKEHASALHPKLLQLGYIFCLLGYGTKAGVFPLHSWLPDAHSEAPAPASAMLSGALLNCALFAICRITELVKLTQYDHLATTLPIVWGALTALAASLFLVHQSGIKRLLAYSSIENVGIMLVAIGLGSPGIFLLQATNHSIAKVSLFLLSGNITQLFGTKELSHIRGVLKSSPTWGILFAVSAVAITGTPPCGAFIAEWLILTRSAAAGNWAVVAGLAAALALSFIAISIHIGKVLMGTPRHVLLPDPQQGGSLIPALLCTCGIILGITGLPALWINHL